MAGKYVIWNTYLFDFKGCIFKFLQFLIPNILKESLLKNLEPLLPQGRTILQFTVHCFLIFKRRSIERFKKIVKVIFEKFQSKIVKIDIHRIFILSDYVEFDRLNFEINPKFERNLFFWSRRYDSYINAPVYMN